MSHYTYLVYTGYGRDDLEKLLDRLCLPNSTRLLRAFDNSWQAVDNGGHGRKRAVLDLLSGGTWALLCPEYGTNHADAAELNDRLGKELAGVMAMTADDYLGVP